MDPLFILSQTDGRPMYLQIIEQIKNKVAVNDWQAGFKLPSIREFAVSLKVSVITVKRAYQELEVQGVIVTQQGKGSYVTGGENMILKMKQDELDNHLIEVLKTASLLNMSIDDITSRLNKIQSEKTTLDITGKNHE